MHLVYFGLSEELVSGKTAISRRLHQFSTVEIIPADGITYPYLKLGFLNAVHFCSSADERWINPKTFKEPPE